MKFFLPIVLSLGLFVGCTGNASEEKSEELHTDHSSTEEMKPEKLLRHAVFSNLKLKLLLKILKPLKMHLLLARKNSSN